MAGPLSRPPINTDAGMVPRVASIAVYVMSNRKHGTLHIGVTSNLMLRASQHREGAIEGFTRSMV